MSQGPSITGSIRLKDETGPTLASLERSISSSFKDIASVAGGIITAEFGRNVVGALEDVGRSSVEQAAAFETATARIIAASGATGDEAEALKSTFEAAAKALGVEFGSGATGAMRAMESLVKAGLDPATEATDALRGVLQLATIEQMSVEAAANMVVQAMTMFGLSAEEATRVVDGFAKASAAGIDTASGYASGLSNVGATAANMSLAMEETLAALVQLDNTFGGATESGTFLNRMLLDLVAKSEEAGIQLYNVDGSMKSLDEIIAQVREEVQGFGEDQRAVNEWLGIFDTRAQKALVALVNYDGSIAETQTALEGMHGAQDQVNLILDTYEGKMEKAQAQQELNNIEIGETTTQLSLMSAEFTASLGPIGNVASALGPQMLSGAVQGLTATYLPQLIGKLVGSGGLTAALGMTKSIIPGVASMIGAAGPIGLAIVGVVAAIALFAAAWKNNWFGIRDVTAKAVNAIKSIIGGIAKAAAKAIKKLKELFKWKKKKGGDSGGGTDESSTSGGVDSTGGAGGGGGPAGEWGEHQHGFEGIVTRPTGFIAGEAGPEAVSITPLRMMPRMRRPIVIQGPLVVVQGNADRRTMEWAVREMFLRLKTVTVENTSSGAATKRIRTGSIFGGAP